jgi:hypothetical protein
MSEEPKRPDIKLIKAAPESIFDNIEELRKSATLKVSRRVVPVNVTVKRPANNVFFRCHSEAEWSLDASVIVGDKGSDDFYFVGPSMEPPHDAAAPAPGYDRNRLFLARRRDIVVACPMG